MDHRDVKWKKEPFEEIAKGMKEMAIKVGFKEDKIKGIVPISGWEGDNLTEKSDRMLWYNGPTLIEALEAVEYVVTEE